MPSDFRLRLYVAGDGPYSTQAMANLDSFCREHLPDTCEIEIVDVLDAPDLAREDGVHVAPTLVKLKPRPVRRIVGALREPGLLLREFGLCAGEP